MLALILLLLPQVLDLALHLFEHHLFRRHGSAPSAPVAIGGTGQPGKGSSSIYMV
jgi:hypothetical protein